MDSTFYYNNVTSDILFFLEVGQEHGHLGTNFLKSLSFLGSFNKKYVCCKILTIDLI